MTAPTATSPLSMGFLVLLLGVIGRESGSNTVYGFVVTPSSIAWGQYFAAASFCNGRVEPLLRAKGFGGGGGGFGEKSARPKKKKKSVKDAKRAQEKLLDQYGGDVARGTSERIQEAMKALPEHIQLAAQLYQQVKRWDAYVAGLSVLQQTKLPTQDTDGARRAKEQLERMYQEYPDELSDRHLHNLFQRVTWDASADAKAARAVMGNMASHIQERVDRACSIVADAVKDAPSGDGKCLDVGCGPGVLVPHLINLGVSPKQIYGIDLSPEMIRNAQRSHRGVNFVAGDVFEPFTGAEDGFDGILFCSSLHDLPDPVAALHRAKSLLRPNGKLVIVHPQGASHVAGQHKSNPVMVKGSLPTAQELVDMNLGLLLERAPTEDESSEGYLAVLSN